MTLHSLIIEYQAHAFAYTTAALSVLGYLLKKFKPSARVSRALQAGVADIPELAAVLISFSSKATLLRALELSGHILTDVAKAAEDTTVTPNSPTGLG